MKAILLLLAWLSSSSFAADGGVVSVDGSSTVYPIAEHLASAFRAKSPEIRVTIAVSGTGGGFKRFAAGETDLSNASRPIKKDELDAVHAKGIEIIELPIAYDGLSVVVHHDATFVDQLTVEQLKTIFLDGGAKTWREINPAWPDQPIHVFSPGTDSGTYDYMRETLTHGDKHAKMRSDLQVSEDDNVLVTGVSGDKSAIGYFGSAYYFENKSRLRAVPIVNKDGKAVLPDHDTITDGSYNPLSRPLLVYVNVASLNKPAVKAFARFVLDNAAEAAAAVGYVALPDELYDRAEANLDNSKTGTQLLGPDGRPREGALGDLYK